MPSNRGTTASGPLLRLTQTVIGENRYRAEVALEGQGLARQTAEATFTFTLADHDQADLRWYLEDYLQYPFDPAPTIAARVEERIAAIGTDLFKAVFQSSDASRDLWATLRDRLNDTRVEIVTGVREATAIPWELLRDPRTATPLALRARAFIRAQPQASQRPPLPEGRGPIRILLVICRPGGRDDVPFRSVASRLVKGLSGRDDFVLDVLRPPTFEQLGKTLRAARANGRPYHVVHFDGHGVYGAPTPPARFPTGMFSRPGQHGYLAFEQPTAQNNLEFIDGPKLGQLLAETGVPVLILNACRSAHADAPEAPHPPALPRSSQDRLSPTRGEGETTPPSPTVGEGARGWGADPASPHPLTPSPTRGEGETTPPSPTGGEGARGWGADAASPSPPVGEGARGRGADPDPHSQVRAFGSLAQEVMDAGVTGVVAMRYNVYVVTAAQFVADLYASLSQGVTLGEAVTEGRKALHAQPLRDLATPRPLQDWPVPVVYEAAPIPLFPKPRQTPRLTISLTATQTTPQRREVTPDLPQPPDVGFLGRDETLLALDRAFDGQSIVLLHAFAGSGKTTTAAEFARWYALTGGLGQGLVLFTSFERHKPLALLVNQVCREFDPLLKQNKIEYLALDDGRRRALALQLLRAVPVLWIWDNVEPVAGFPSGTASVWTASEQRELADFLREARATQAKFLLTSRREERGWLGDLPARVSLPPMPMQERVLLARALAEKHGRRLTEVEDWRPLLRYTQGNPLTLTVLVGQALRDGLTTRPQIEAFVARLQAGEAAFQDEQDQGRSRSLGASLSYGFDQTFDEAERRVLALLHFFQGFVDVDVLCAMGHPDAEWCLPTVRGLTREAGLALLDRAAEVGLLTAHGKGYYSIHPALPWFFRGLFEQYYPAGDLTPRPSFSSLRTSSSLPGKGEPDTPPLVGEGSGERSASASSPPFLGEGSGERSASASSPPLVGEGPGERSASASSPPFVGEGPGERSATRAFVEALGELGNYYWREYNQGNPDVIGALSVEEANLLHARQLARANGWYHRITSVMQGLHSLYAHTGRRAEWRRLVEDIAPDFVDPATDGPRPDREEQWSLVTQYRVDLAQETRDWATAERLLRLCVDWDRQRATPALARPADALDATQRHLIRTLAMSVGQLGQILADVGKLECSSAHQEAYELCLRIDDKPGAAVAAFNLGHAYLAIPALRDLAQADTWYRRSLELREPRDRLGRGKVFVTLGNVAYERFLDARTAGRPDAELLEHLNTAIQRYHEALALFPANAVNDLAVTHNQLGLIYHRAGDLDRALPHYRESIRYKEQAGNFYGVATTNFNVALALANAGRLGDALLYAQAALRDYERYSTGVAAEIEKTQRLIADIQAAMGKR